MSNPWKKFQGLFAPGAKMTVTVLSVDADGSLMVQLRSGESIRVSGDGYAVNDKVIIQDNKVIGKAPDLPVHSFEV